MLSLNSMPKIINWIRKVLLGYETFYGCDLALDNKDYSCFLKGKKYKDGTVVIENVEYLDVDF